MNIFLCTKNFTDIGLVLVTLRDVIVFFMLRTIFNNVVYVIFFSRGFLVIFCMSFLRTKIFSSRRQMEES